MSDTESVSLLKMLSVAVFILGGWIVMDLTAPPTRAEPEKVSQRQPASLITVREATGSRSAMRSVVSTLSLECIESLQNVEIKSQSRQLRLVGKSCVPTEDTRPLSITNTSNGFVATVFQKPNQEFTTDYMYLKDGMNHIVIARQEATTDVAPVKISEFFVEKGRLSTDSKLNQ